MFKPHIAIIAGATRKAARRGKARRVAAGKSKGARWHLLGFMLSEARTRGFRIIPICRFVRKRYARHPEWADTLTTRPGEDPKPQ